MAFTIAVAGATGQLGHKIVGALRQEGVEVTALVRPQADQGKIAGLEAAGAQVIRVDLSHNDELVTALGGADVVISALNGLRPVIIDAQKQLLDASVAAGVRRFVPSDFAADFTKTANESNRNFDLRREFAAILDAAPIEKVSILNGMFMDLLAYGMPLFDMRKGSVTYWGDADQRYDLTTMDDTAKVTALAVLDMVAPRYIRVAGDQISPRQLASLGEEMTGKPFALVRAGSIEELGAAIEKARAADPDGENQDFPRFQQMQYIRNMASGKAKLDPVNNDRFSGVAWTRVRDLATTMLAR